jgi:hypothetical protein
VRKQASSLVALVVAFATDTPGAKPSTRMALQRDEGEVDVLGRLLCHVAAERMALVLDATSLTVMQQVSLSLCVWKPCCTCSATGLLDPFKLLAVLMVMWQVLTADVVQWADGERT